MVTGLFSNGWQTGAGGWEDAYLGVGGTAIPNTANRDVQTFILMCRSTNAGGAKFRVNSGVVVELEAGDRIPLRNFGRITKLEVDSTGDVQWVPGVS